MIKYLKKIFRFKKKSVEAPELQILKFSCFDDYEKKRLELEKVNKERLNFENSLIPENQEEFFYKGYCYICRKKIDFLVDFKYSCKINKLVVPNWRERLVCPICKLNNRMRATIHIFLQEFSPDKNSNIYLTEQTTPVFNWFKKNFSNVIGSEYLDQSCKPGEYNEKNIRNEDLTNLTFSNNQFDYILSFDVFEHIPDYKKALKECFRCLKKEGFLYFSVPFIKNQKKNLVRAIINNSGEVDFLLPAEYHGDPVNKDGCLCFYHFGWDILDELRKIGFSNVNALIYWSKEFGYLGGEQILFVAQK